MTTGFLIILFIVFIIGCVILEKHNKNIPCPTTEQQINMLNSAILYDKVKHQIKLWYNDEISDDEFISIVIKADDGCMNNDLIDLFFDDQKQIVKEKMQAHNIINTLKDRIKHQE